MKIGFFTADYKKTHIVDGLLFVATFLHIAGNVFAGVYIKFWIVFLNKLCAYFVFNTPKFIFNFGGYVLAFNVRPGKVYVVISVFSE